MAIDIRSPIAMEQQSSTPWRRALRQAALAALLLAAVVGTVYVAAQDGEPLGHAGESQQQPIVGGPQLADLHRGAVGFDGQRVGGHVHAPGIGVDAGNDDGHSRTHLRADVDQAPGQHTVTIPMPGRRLAPG